MIHDIFLGLIAGLVSAISFGPVFFAITEASLKNGFFSGVVVAIGVSFSDISYITLILLGYLKWFNNEEYQFLLGLAGGLVLVGYGSMYIIKKVRFTEQSIEPVLKGTTLIQSFVKGFVINTLNPYVAAYWIGVVAFSSTQLTLSSKNGLFIYFTTVLLTLVGVDIIKSYLASVLRLSIYRYVPIVYRVVGILFVGFGGKLLYDSYALWLK